MTQYVMYDTNALLDLGERILQKQSFFYLTDITLKELESIKTSGKKDEETKYNARKVLHFLDENPSSYEVVLFKKEYAERCEKFDFSDTPDTRIIYTTFCFFEERGVLTSGVFVTGDLACKALARAIGLNVESLKKEEQNPYCGYLEVNFNDQKLADFYDKVLYQNINIFNLLENEYLILKNNDKVVDKYKWAENEYKQIPYLAFCSKMFNKVTPYKGDIYQLLAMDSFASNQVTLVRGKPGSGKSFLSLAYLFSLLEHGKIDRIIIFCNTVAAKGAAKLGFYPGDKDSKLLDSQIGNFLASKLGDKVAIERMIEDGELMLLPLADIRGFDTSGMNAGVYITEAQNMDIELMKLALQRIGSDSICIIDGDNEAQVDLSMYAGNNNGMKRLSQVFRGSDIYGEVTLKNIHRSKIATLAQEM